MAFVRTRSIQTRNIGSSNVLARAVGDAYAVDGFEPELAFDFTGETYRTDGSATTFSGAMTHSATSLGTMVDGYGPELVTNGNFNSDTAWTKGAGWTISDGVAVGSSATSNLQQAFPAVSGRTYEISFDIVSYTSGNINRVQVAAVSGPILLASAIGTYVSHITAPSTGNLVLYIVGASGFTGSIDNISVREVPAIKWRPHNLFTYSEDFSNAVWFKGIGYNSTISTDQTVSPSGLIDADALVSDSAGGSGYVITARLVSVTSGTSYTLSIYAKGNTLSWMQLYLLGYTSPGNGGAYFDLQNGEVGTVTSGYTAQIADIGNGWYRCSLSFTAGASVSGEMRVLLADSDNDSSVARDGVTSIYIWGAHLYRSDLGGMVDNPDRGDSYVPTAVRVLPSAPELVTNGHFNSGIDGWTDGNAEGTIAWNASGYMDLARNSGSGGGIATQSITTTSGKYYLVTFDIISLSHGIKVYFGTPGSDTFTTTGTKTFIAAADASSETLRFDLLNSATATATIDNVSVKESYIDPSVARYLPRRGHYVYNGTEWTNRGLLLESEARTNDFLYSEDFTQAAWSKTNTATLAIDATGPDGQTSAVTLVDNGATGTGGVFVYEGVTVSTSTTYTFSTFAKADQLNEVLLWVSSFTTPANNGYVFDLTDGTYTASSGTPDMTPLMEDYGNGWYRCSVTFTTDAADTSGALGIYIADGGSSTVDLDGTSSILIYGAQFEEGSVPSSYMPTNGATFTRAAETLTVAAADLPYPTPNIVGSELVTNGTFDSDTTGWTGLSSATLSVSSGSLRVTNVGANYGKAEQSLSVTSGKVYIVTFDKIGGNSTEARFRIGTTSAGTNIINNVDVSTDASYSYTFKATASTIYLSFVNDGTDGNYNIWDNISVKESYIDPSVARYLPRRGHYVYNGQEWTNRGLLLESEARTNYVDSSDGSGLGVVRASTSAGTSVWIDGVSTMVKIVENTESNSHAGYETPVGAFTDDTVYTFSVYLKADERSWAKLSIKKKNSSIVGAWFDLSNGVLGTIEAGTASATLEDCGNGIYRCSVSVDIGTGANAQQVFVYTSTADNTISYTGDGSSGLECYGLQFEAGSTPSSYMPTNGATFTRSAETLTVAAADLPSTITPIVRRAALVTAGWTITDGGAV